MAKFLTTRGITYELETLVRQADTHLVLVTPYLKLAEGVQERLISASERGVHILIVFGKSALSRKEERALRRIENLEIRFYRDLHAKCYHNGASVIVTSMNLHEYSEVNNREVGVLLVAGHDDEAIRDAIGETEDIARHADLLFDATVQPDLRSFSLGSGGEPRDATYTSRLVPLVEAMEPEASVQFNGAEIFVHRLFEWSLSCKIELSESRYRFTFTYKANYRTHHAVVPVLQRHLGSVASRIEADVEPVTGRSSKYTFTLGMDRSFSFSSGQGADLSWTKTELDVAADSIVKVLEAVRGLVRDVSGSVQVQGRT